MIERIPDFRLGPFRKTTVYGTDKKYPDPYMTRVSIGRLSLHVFHRADADPDPHDHEEDFWTFPLGPGYFEHVMDPKTYAVTTAIVDGWRWTHRPAEYAHRVAGTLKRVSYPNFFGRAQVVRVLAEKWPLVTLVWRGERRRQWGFWVQVFHPENAHYREFIPWRDYIFTDWRGMLELRKRRRGAA